ncbi:hypothetical protein BKA93DRAFT_754350 [Sparassis latifolia]
MSLPSRAFSTRGRITSVVAVEMRKRQQEVVTRKKKPKDHAKQQGIHQETGRTIQEKRREDEDARWDGAGVRLGAQVPYFMPNVNDVGVLTSPRVEIPLYEVYLLNTSRTNHDANRRKNSGETEVQPVIPARWESKQSLAPMREVTKANIGEQRSEYTHNSFNVQHSMLQRLQ